MKFISVGRVAGSYGLEGCIKVKPNTDNPWLFDEMEYLLLTKNGELKRSLKIEGISVHNNVLIFKLSGISSDKQADSLKGMDVSVTEDSLPELSEDEVYLYQILGLPVYNESGSKVGVLVDLMETGAADVFRIELMQGGYALISNNKDHVLEINTDENKIVISESGLVYEDI